MRRVLFLSMLAASARVLANAPELASAPVDFHGLGQEPGYSALDDSHRSMLKAETNQLGAQSRRIVAKAGGGRFDFQFVNVAQLITLLYGEAVKTPYVIAPEVLQDQRVVSFRYDARSGDLRAFLALFLDSLGFAVETRSGVDFVFRRPDGGHQEAERNLFVYRPQFRDTAYLARLVGPLFRGEFTVNRSVSAPADARLGGTAPSGSAAALIDQRGDTLLFYGTADEVVTLQQLLPELDTAVGEVNVRAAAYEVGNNTEHGSAFQLATSLLSEGLGVTLEGDVLGSTLRLRAGKFDAVFSALAKDTRFKVINSPNLRIRSGAKGRLTVGQRVPILKSVSYPRGGGEPVQSVEYLSSGVIFELSPTVKDRIIDLHVTQQISDFVKTTTGVNNSPTLNTREISTEISLHDGDVILMGGLTTNKTTGNRTGLAFLPRFLDSESDAKSSTEILLVLQVERVGASSVGSVGADDEAEASYEPDDSVREVVARLSAARATEQRVPLLTPAGALSLRRTHLPEKQSAERVAAGASGFAKAVEVKQGLRATAAARRGEDGGGARTAPRDLYK